MHILEWNILFSVSAATNQPLIMALSPAPSSIVASVTHLVLETQVNYAGLVIGEFVSYPKPCFLVNCYLTSNRLHRIDIYKISNPSTAAYNPVLPDCTRDPLCSNDVCDSSLSVADRAAALVGALTLQEKINNVQGSAAGVSGLQIPSYEWDSEGLHGVADSTGVRFETPLGVNFSSATSFPMPLSIAASFDDLLTIEIAKFIGTEAQGFVNGGHAGLAYMTPNLNGYRDPRWGRGMETPGEAVLVIQNYVKSLVPELQGGVNPKYNALEM